MLIKKNFKCVCCNVFPCSIIIFASLSTFIATSSSTNQKIHLPYCSRHCNKTSISPNRNILLFSASFNKITWTQFEQIPHQMLTFGKTQQNLSAHQKHRLNLPNRMLYQRVDIMPKATIINKDTDLIPQAALHTNK